MIWEIDVQGNNFIFIFSLAKTKIFTLKHKFDCDSLQSFKQKSICKNAKISFNK